MAVEFEEKTGPRWLIGANVPIFPMTDASKFPRFLRAIKQAERAELRDEPKTLIRAYLRDHPESRAAIVTHGRRLRRSPITSFCETSYHSNHAFVLHRLGQRPPLVVRFRFEPLAGEHVAQDPIGGERLRDELKHRLRDPTKSSEFNLFADVADETVDPADVTKSWPRTCRRLLLGRLTLTSSHEGSESWGVRPDQLPEPFTPLDADLLLCARRDVYEHAQRLRRKR